MGTCIVRGCHNNPTHGHKIFSEEVQSCDEHFDQVWLIFKNAHFDILAIIEELHWKCRNLEEGGDEG